MSYKALANQIRATINNLPEGTEFYLKDIIENPPAQLGREDSKCHLHYKRKRYCSKI